MLTFVVAIAEELCEEACMVTDRCVSAQWLRTCIAIQTRRRGDKAAASASAIGFSSTSS